MSLFLLSTLAADMKLDFGNEIGGEIYYLCRFPLTAKKKPTTEKKVDAKRARDVRKKNKIITNARTFHNGKFSDSKTCFVVDAFKHQQTNKRKFKFMARNRSLRDLRCARRAPHCEKNLLIFMRTAL